MTALPELICPSGVPSAVAGWRSQRHGEACLVVCKVTYRIEPGEMALSSEHDPLVGRDVHWDDDPARSLRAASDFAAFKRRAEVLVVGSAFAAPGAKVHRLVSYFSVAELEKAIELQPDRWVNLQDELQYGAPFSRMPLAWERAAYDEDGGNPVGRVATRDAYGRLNLPNLQPPAFEPRSPSWSVPLVGLGPLSPAWARRAAALTGPRTLAPGPSGALWPESWLNQGVPEDAQLSFFQVAPRDQQLDRLPTDASVVLEHLCPTAARLGTRLPGDRVRAFAGPQVREIELTCDTLVLDTDRQIATLTWRGSYFVSKTPQVDRVLVSFERRDHRFSPEDVSAALARPHPTALPFSDHPPASHPPRASGSYAGTPFGPGQGTLQKPELSAAPPAVPSFETTELPALAAAALGNTQLGRTFLGTAAERATSAGPASGASPPAIVASAPPARASAPPPMPPPPVSQPRPDSSPGLVSSPRPAPVLQRMAPQSAPLPAPPTPSASVPSYMVDARETVPTEVVSHDAKAASAGALSASNAAAGEPRSEPAKPRPSPDAKAPPKPTGFFDLLWFSDQAPERLRLQPSWSKLIRDGKGEWLTPKMRDGRSPEDAEALVGRALARGTPLDAAGVGRAVLDAVDQEGFLVRPIVVVEGEVALSFDPVESLTVSLSLSEPLAASDRKFKEVHTATSELVAANRKVTLPMIEAGLVRIRQAFAGAGKAYPPAYLETTAERWLVDERKYFKRTVLGQARLVASIGPLGGGPALPLYLPADLEQFLPTVPRLRARVLAEPHAKQDAADGEPTSLVAIAFARVIGR